MSAADNVPAPAATTDEPAAPATTTRGSRRRPDYGKLRPYIYLLAKKLDPEVTLSTSAVDVLEDLFLDLLSRLVKSAVDSTKYAKRKTTTQRDVYLAGRMVLPLALYTKARERGTVACTKFTQSFAASPAAAKRKATAVAAVEKPVAQDSELMNVVV